MKYLYLIIILVISGFGFSQNQSRYNPKPKYVGIETEKIDEVMTAQDNTYWCWAASVQIILNYYDVDITQEDIVQKLFGRNETEDLPDTPADMKTIHKTLNYVGKDNSGAVYKVESKLGKGTPTASILIEQLAKKRPVLVGYLTPSGGHIVVVTAVSYIDTPSGPKIASIIVRDPMPEAAFSMNNGKIEYPGKYFARKMTAYWFVDVKWRSEG